MAEVRYAILVGINDYKKQPLHFCDKDVAMIKNRLVNNCLFEKGNVHEIVSTIEKPVHDVFTELKKIIEKIRESFVLGVDTIKFYFSGHGKFEKETILEFHESNITVQEVFDMLNALSPANNILMIDACHSGYGIDVKSSEEANAITAYYNQRYIAKAAGAYFLCSCKQDEKSKAFPKYNSSVYTKYFCEAIDNGNLYDEDSLSVSLSDIHQYTSKKISLNGEYQQTPFFQTKSHGYYPFAFKSKSEVITSCLIKLNQSDDENEIVKFLLSPQLNMSVEFRRDFGQFISEMVLNLFKHNYSRSVSISVEGNTIEIRDDSDIQFNPFGAEETAEGNGVKVYKLFLAKYAGKVRYSFVEGTPNIINFEFDKSIFDSGPENPCYIQMPTITLLSEKLLNKYKLNGDCDEIVIDISKSVLPASHCFPLFESLLKRTSDKSPLIIIKMNEKDMLRDYFKNIIKINFANDRIILV